MKNLIKYFMALMIMMVFSCTQEGTWDPTAITADTDKIIGVSAKASKATVDVFDVVNGVIAGSATLHRNSNGLTMNFKATGLIPGHAYTIWWVIWNNPEECAAYPGECAEPDFENADAVEVEVLYAAGHVVGNSGKGNFSGHLNENDSEGTVNPLFGLNEYGGLHDAETAEVHLVLRSHGPAIPGMIHEQIGSYEGGCDDPFAIPPFTEIPDEVGECGDIYASVHQP